MDTCMCACVCVINVETIVCMLFRMMAWFVSVHKYIHSYTYAIRDTPHAALQLEAPMDIHTHTYTHTYIYARYDVPFVG